MKLAIRILPAALRALLAACANAPLQPVAGPVEIPSPVPAPVAPVPDIESPAAQTAGADVWTRLRGSFAMPGCDADPAVLGWARRYTRHPKQFESQLQAVLPRLVYVQKVAEDYDVAGEFVLLPWVESHFRPIAARKHRPAGMWQLMPVTAGLVMAVACAMPYGPSRWPRQAAAPPATRPAATSVAMMLLDLMFPPLETIRWGLAAV